MADSLTRQNDVSLGYGLSEELYSFGYKLRLKYATFRRATMTWLLDNSRALIASETPKILSLGCGDGEFDVDLIDHLRRTRDRFRFCGVDFNRTDLERFRRLVLTRDETFQNNVVLRRMKYEASSEMGEHYDFIYMVHFLHSFEEVLPVILNAIGHLAPGGKLLIIQQQRKGIFELKQKFRGVLPNLKFHHSEEIKSLLREERVAFSSHVIDTYFDISVMQTMSLDALLLMSFCLTNDLAALETQQQEQIRAEFLAYATVRENGTPVIYEPMEAIVCQA